MTEILFARKTDVDGFASSLASINAVLNAADFITGTAQAGLGAERVATTSTSVIATLAAGTITWQRAALTGDITAAQNNNATTLATVNANVGSFGLAASVSQFTVNAKGLITAAANVPISITSASVTDFTEAAQDAVGTILTDSSIIDFTYNDGANTITATVINNSIGDAQLRQGAARSVIGVTGNATANVADIQGTADQVLRVNTAGTALAFGTVATGGIAAAAVTYAKIQDISATSRILGRKTAGAGSTEELTLSDALDFIGSAAKGDVLYRDTSTWTRLPIGSATNVLTVAGGVPTWAAAAGGSGSVTRRTISSADTAGLTDKGNLIEITSGTFTLAFTAAATLTNGWWTYIFNHGTGDVTLDPNGAELIDGLTTWVLYPGGAILVQGDGTGFHSILLAPMRRQFDASGTFTKPGVGTIAVLEGWGAGGGASRSATAANTRGGGGGAYKLRVLPLSSLGTTETVSVGAGGAGRTGSAGVGVIGGNTTIGSLLTAFAGAGGVDSGGGSAFGRGGAHTVAGNGSGAGAARFGDLSTVPSASIGQDAINPWDGGAGANTNQGGSSTYGGGGGGSGAGGASATAGTSQYGGNGGAAAASGSNGTQPGGGGGASINANTDGANGADGRAIITVS